MRFSINASVSTEDHKLHTIEDEFETEAQAKQYAREFAEELYYLNPKRDVLEILTEEGDIDEDTAKIVFQLEMIRNITYFVEEVAELKSL